ncbi:tRNA (adenosine(37)-N6)-threonylcarbamoyltransferase complex ATPase subunit type 1 TsaE [Lewinellaceae bacterium SD302]|nr:tRNA (adenosine(37)-N6)-threonylcarbamoyltransferase complex ATPase subunit type 1 TsaE [Lewinellaceae bacterium SD302]
MEETRIANQLWVRHEDRIFVVQRLLFVSYPFILPEHSFTLTELPTVVEQLRHDFPTTRIFTLTGDLGAGKTTLVSEFCRQIGIEDEPSSPTFSIVNEYAGMELVVYHVDCYRLENIEEALNIGFEDYLERGDYCFIEWPAVIEPLLPSGVVHIHLSHPAKETGEDRRILRVTTPAT